MKRVLFVTAFAVLSLATQAQVRFGVKAGANIASLSGDDVEDVKSKVGIYAGGLASIPVTKSLSLQPEILFSMEGAKQDGEDGGKFNLNYINVPVLLHYMFTPNFFGEVGPQLGILMSAKAKSGDISVDLKDEFKSINFGAAIGLGYALESGLGFNARYNLGLGNIADGENADVKTNAISIGVFYMFGHSSSSKK